MALGFPFFLLLSLMIFPASLMPSPPITGPDWKDITDINKGLNLHEGDIMLGKQRSAILGETHRWDNYVPYVLDSTLSTNDKGVILRAFEQLMLRTCIDFKPWTTEVNYLSLEGRPGCWSFVGKTSGKQVLSIGPGCGYLAIIQHEVLHALGFHHEQSRYDRDDYVTIVYEHIIAGLEGNFGKVSEQWSTVSGTPYDYLSVMHYGQYDFSNGNGTVIDTKLPEYQNWIGQRFDMSYWDAYELNKLYNCNASISFLDHCNFNNNMCQMNTCMSSSPNTHGWERVSSVPGGPFTDHTYLGPQPSNTSYLSSNTSLSGPSFFMHFSTKNRQPGESGRLESRIMKPQRNCHVQCLEFSYYHSGNETDQLNIWIREYQNEVDTTGTLRLMDHITGPPNGYWQLHQVPLNSGKPFLVEFEARKGNGVSTGGFSVDDINLSETECSHVWQIRDVETLWNTETYVILESPMYYTPDGYRIQGIVWFYYQYLYIKMRMVSGVYDNQLQWPVPWRQVTFLLLDQNPNIQQRMSRQLSFTTDPNEKYGDNYFWDNPRITGTPLQISENETVYLGPETGNTLMIEKGTLTARDFGKGGDLIFLLSMQDISALQDNNSLPCARVPVKNLTVSPYQGFDRGSCATQAIPTPPAPTKNITTTTTTKPSECLDIFCSGANIIYSSVTLLLALVLLVVN